MVFHLRQNYRYHNSDITIFEGRSILVRCLQYLQFGKHKLIADTIIYICNCGSYAISWSNIYRKGFKDADCTNLRWKHEDQLSPKGCCGTLYLRLLQVFNHLTVQRKLPWPFTGYELFFRQFRILQDHIQSEGRWYLDCALVSNRMRTVEF